MKFLRAAAAIAIGWVLSGCASSTAPGAVGVTRQQLLMLPSANVNAQAAVAYSKLSADARSAGKLNNNDAVVVRVRTIGQHLIREVPAFRRDAADWAWEINVVDSPVVNALCAPGGKILVYTGIIDRLDLTDDELAAVMGHEISHALREHSREKASQAVLTKAVVDGIANSGSRNASTAAGAASVGALLFLHLPFSRDMELEADQMGLELMARAGYDPKAAPNVWRKMQARLGAGGAEFLSTHPSHARRADEMEAVLPKVVPLFAAAPQRAPSVLPPTIPVVATAALPAGAALTPVPIGASALVQVGGKPAAALGQESYTVKKMARTERCHANPQALLTAKGPGFETYTVACAAGEVWSVRCDFGQCRVLK